MHIPDGYLDLRICILFYILSGIYILIAVWRTSKVFRESHIPLFATLSAFVFAGQLLDWPIPGGTTAHFTGGALAGILLGPFGGALVMAVVLIVQAFVFGDGGILALGANLWNMAIVAPLTGFITYIVLGKVFGRSGALVGAFIGGWLGAVLASLFAGLQLGLSTIFLYPITITVPAMVFYHLGFGLIDGLVNIGALMYITKYHPHIIEIPKI